MEPMEYKEGEYVVVYAKRVYSKAQIITVYPVTEKGERYYWVHYVVSI